MRFRLLLTTVCVMGILGGSFSSQAGGCFSRKGKNIDQTSESKKIKKSPVFNVFITNNSNNSSPPPSPSASSTKSFSSIPSAPPPPYPGESQVQKQKGFWGELSDKDIRKREGKKQKTLKKLGQKLPNLDVMIGNTEHLLALLKQAKHQEEKYLKLDYPIIKCNEKILKEFSDTREQLRVFFKKASKLLK